MDSTPTTELSTEAFLADLRQRRDTAIARFGRWTLSREELYRGYKAGERNFNRANLDGANLINTPGLYVACAPNLSSRGAALLGGLVLHNGKIELRFWAGCQTEITAANLLERVAETHEDNPLHAEQYKAAVKFIQACFKADMKAGKWDYLLTWKHLLDSEVQE